MIHGIFHEGSGLGNQLHRYVMTRVIALDKGFGFAMAYPNLFKGASFMNLDMGNPKEPIDYKFLEKSEKNEQGNEVRDYDWSIKDIQDNTIIDGEFQGEKYYEHRLNEIREWLKVEPLEMPDDLCVINFRGGEYVYVQDLFLSKEYWDRAITQMRSINPNMRFEVHTDDPGTAELFFSGMPIIKDMEINWRSIRYAKYLILSNSSFAILPALLGNAKKIIAPLYWAGYNKGYWQLRQNQYKRFTYI